MAVPVDHLTAAELGARLQVLPPSGPPPLPGVRLARDDETGVTWWLRTGHGAGQAQLEVAAGVLYRAADVAASTWRLVETDAGLAVAQEARVAWSPATAEDLVASSAASAVDLWLGNLAGPGGVRRRLFPVPGPRVLRLDLAHTLGWDGLGLRRSSSGWPVLPRPSPRPDVSPLRGVTRDEIDEAIAAAQIDAQSGGRLRDVLLARLSVLVGG